MAENEQDNLPTPSEFLNMIVKGEPLDIGGNIVKYSKNEYTVTDIGGNIVFRRIPNAMSFWELVNFLGIEEI